MDTQTNGHTCIKCKHPADVYLTPGRWICYVCAGKRKPTSKQRKPAHVILGLGADATQTEIKKRYRELAKQYHPDATNQDKYKEVKFKEICMAYEDLTDS